MKSSVESITDINNTINQAKFVNQKEVPAITSLLRSSEQLDKCLTLLGKMTVEIENEGGDMYKLDLLKDKVWKYVFKIDHKLANTAGEPDWFDGIDVEEEVWSLDQAI